MLPLSPTMEFPGYQYTLSLRLTKLLRISSHSPATMTLEKQQRQSLTKKAERKSKGCKHVTYSVAR